MAVRSGVRHFVRLIETEWNKKGLAGIHDWFYINPSIITVRNSTMDLVEMGILTKTYQVMTLSLLGEAKIVVARCEAPRAMEWWDKGIKPKPKEISDESDD